MKLLLNWKFPMELWTEAELVHSLKEQTALKLYAKDRVTTGEAAEMLGLRRIQLRTCVAPVSAFTSNWTKRISSSFDAGVNNSRLRTCGECRLPQHPAEYLALLSDFGLLRRIYGSLIIPPAVYREVVQTGASYPGLRGIAGGLGFLDLSGAGSGR